MITNNSLQKLIENKKFQLPEEYLCSRAKTKIKGHYQKINIDIDSLVERYYPEARFIRVGEDETFDEKYAKNVFIPYLRILDIIKKHDLITCLQIDCGVGHLLYLARLMNLDYFGFCNNVTLKDKELFINTFQNDCLIKFELNNVYKLNHYFDVIIHLTSNYDEIAFKQLLRILSNKTKYVLLNINKQNYSLLKYYDFVTEIESFTCNKSDTFVFLMFPNKLNLSKVYNFQHNNQNNLISLNRK